MNKSILLSVKPNWVAKILNGEKTIEIRKRPIPVGIKVYIYVTKSGLILQIDRTNNFCRLWKEKNNRLNCGYLNGKVVASFVVDKCIDMMKWFYTYKDNEFFDILKKACISTDFLQKYAGNNAKKLYALHISQLKIFDKPKELSEFKRANIGSKGCFNCKRFGTGCNNCLIEKAPQSYCYIKEVDL